MNMTGPLDGIRVVDMTSILMGPYAAQLMGDMGADVIKVESPQGDMVRDVGPMLHPAWVRCICMSIAASVAWCWMLKSPKAWRRSKS